MGRSETLASRPETILGMWGTIDQSLLLTFGLPV